MSDRYPAEDRLAILRMLDTWRGWHSLDDARVCVRCGQVITGAQIKIAADAHGKAVLKCPTQDCDSTPEAWAYHLFADRTGSPPLAKTTEFSFL